VKLGLHPAKYENSPAAGTIGEENVTSSYFSNSAPGTSSVYPFALVTGWNIVERLWSSWENYRSNVK
jgi:hypothetical protein